MRECVWGYKVLGEKPNECGFSGAAEVNSSSDTPRVDAKVNELILRGEATFPWIPLAHLARQLEREMAEARAREQRLRDLLDAENIGYPKERAATSKRAVECRFCGRLHLPEDGCPK